VYKSRRDADAIAYVGAIAAVFFLILSGITGYLIEPYSTMVTSPLLLNKSLTALGALYFWAAYVFIRYWCGPGLWRKNGLYALAFITSIFAILFTTIAGSIGAKLSAFGESVLDPFYSALEISFSTFVLTQVDVYITVGLMIVVIAVVGAAARISETHRRV
jgi:hypothetical protein